MVKIYLCLHLFLALSFVYSSERLKFKQKSESSAQQCNINPVRRFDCHPETGASKHTCLVRGCCWSGNPAETVGTNSQPMCYYPLNYPGYTATDLIVTPLGYRLELVRYTPTYYPKNVKVLNVDLMFETSSRLHVKVNICKYFILCYILSGLRLKKNPSDLV